MENNGSNENNFVVTQICLKKELVQFSEKKNILNSSVESPYYLLLI